MDIAEDPRPTLAEYLSMAATKYVPSAIFSLHMVLIKKAKLEQSIKAGIRTEIFKDWILKTILLRHYYSIKGLEKAVLKYILKYRAMV